MTDKITGVKKPVTIDQQQLAQELVSMPAPRGWSWSVPVGC